jgi:hypothetical protein
VKLSIRIRRLPSQTFSSVLASLLLTFMRPVKHATITHMKAFETSTTVEPQGDVRVVGVPFAPGTEVEVTISPKRKTAAEFAEAWLRVSTQLRQLPQANGLSDDEIQQQIDDYRAER